MKNHFLMPSHIIMHFLTQTIPLIRVVSFRRVFFKIPFFLCVIMLFRGRKREQLYNKWMNINNISTIFCEMNLTD